MVPRMRVLLSKTGYTNIKLALIYLEHLNQHLNSIQPKVLLMDQHRSHIDD
jgi:hypothetical protein